MVYFDFLMKEKDLKDRQKEIDALVVKAQTGDTDAFAKLYDLYVNPIFRYISFKVPREDALDLTETVFLRVWEHLKSYKKLTGSFSSWVFKIAHNLVVDHYRVRREHASIEDVAIVDEKHEANPALQTETKLSRAMLRTAIAQLKKKHQQVLLLRYITGLEHREIAKIMKRSEGNLRILKFRALQALRKVLEGMNITY